MAMNMCTLSTIFAWAPIAMPCTENPFCQKLHALEERRLSLDCPQRRFNGWRPRNSAHLQHRVEAKGHPHECCCEEGHCRCSLQLFRGARLRRPATDARCCPCLAPHLSGHRVLHHRIALMNMCFLTFLGASMMVDSIHVPDKLLSSSCQLRVDSHGRIGAQQRVDLMSQSVYHNPFHQPYCLRLSRDRRQGRCTLHQSAPLHAAGCRITSHHPISSNPFPQVPCNVQSSSK